jgi:hypothetical protein
MVERKENEKNTNKKVIVKLLCLEFPLDRLAEFCEGYPNPSNGYELEVVFFQIKLSKTENWKL